MRQSIPFDWSFPYRSQRMPVLARNVVATSQPLAAQAGLEILRAGGNAIDAAVACAITLTVVEPNNNGIGGDLFAIVWDGKALYGLNASGRSPAGWTRNFFCQFEAMPLRGWHAVTVPGAVSGWVELSRKFGTLPFERLFEPAIRYAREGFLVSPITAMQWSNARETFRDYPDFHATFCPSGRAPGAGELFHCEDQAQSLESIAHSNGGSFYRGELAEKIIAHAKLGGGLMTMDDLASHQPDWVDTVSVEYRGYELHEIPPNGQGIAALMALGILRHLPIADAPVDSAESLHLQIEAMKLAFADIHRHVSDPAHAKVRPADMLEADYLRARARLIDRTRAGAPDPGEIKRGGTVYLTAADSEGRMVSLIQSNYSGFGSGIVVPGTGISMQNRGHGFTFEEAHPNEVGPRKRPFHTILPGFLLRDGKPVMSFGVMGGAMQAQGHVQMVVRLIDYHQNPQAACDAPRWRVVSGKKVFLEHGTNPEVVQALQSMGHEIELRDYADFGGGQFIYRLDNGYLGASDPRKDGQAVGY
ncbi:MAG TPA: gamma-glutamyltransferase [Tepidisphaeraceae bacterium]|jgi:gamma-glutamyltranspeptidase/glutathione hydrolase|nr:gamma-glutamyltransferase [Tepidisphaeraceae bacterium]